MDDTNNTENSEVPFDMSKETLKSIRLWIDDITKLSVGIISGQKINPNEMIILKQKMVKQLIILSSPLLSNDLEEIEEYFGNINMKKGDMRTGTGWNRNVIIYNKEVDYKLDECIQRIQKSLKRYFVPTFKKGEKY
jgi:hypothetical protein